MARVNVYLPDDLAAEAKSRDINISASAQKAIREEIERMSAVTETPSLKRYIDGAEKITVLVEDGYEHEIETEFRGAWILDPDDHIKSVDLRFKAGTGWGVAVTGRGRIAVFAFDTATEAGTLDDYDTLNEALAELPDDIGERVMAVLTGSRVLDI